MTVTKKHVRDLVRCYQKIMGMQDWRITINYSVTDDDHYAECDASPWNKKATIAFNLEKHDSLDEAEGTVRHELFHAFLNGFVDIAQTLAGGDESPAGQALFALEEQLACQFEAWPVWKEYGYIGEE